MTELVQFCQQHGTAKLRAASVQSLTLYLTWCIARNAVATVEDAGEIVAVGIGWPVRDEGRQMVDPLWSPVRAAVPESPLLYVANLAAPDAESRQRVIEWASGRWPGVREFCGHRTKHGRDVFYRYPLRAAARLYSIGT